MAVGAAVERQAGQGPADGAVAQREYRVGDTGIDQRLRADDRPRASGAVHHDHRARIGRRIAHAQGQFATGHAAPGRDAHGRIFLGAARVEDDKVLARLQAPVQLGRRQRRRVQRRLDQLAERLARHVDVLEQLAARSAPAIEVALQDRHLAVAEPLQHRQRPRDQPFSRIVEHDRCGSPRHQVADQQLDPAERHVDREQRMGARIGSFLAQVEQRDLDAVAQPPAHLLRRYGRAHDAAGLAERSQRLGRVALA